MRAPFVRPETKGKIMASKKKVYHFSCGQCGKKTSSPYAKRAAVRLCGECAPDVDALPAMAPKAKAKKSAPPKKAMPRIRLNFNRPSTKKANGAPAIAPVVPDLPATEPDAVSLPVMVADAAPVPDPVLAGDDAAVVPALESAVDATLPVGVDTDALDARITEAREAMNRMATDLSAKRVELATLREQRRALGPAPRVHRDPNAPRRPTLLDAAAHVLADADAPMQAKAIWRAIVERGLWQTPNGGKTPYATLAAALMRDIAAKDAASRFVKAGRGLFDVNSTLTA